MSFHAGQRVYVGWTPKCKPLYAPARCNTGVLIDGPFQGWCETIDGCLKFVHPSWNVQMDSGMRVRAAEKILFPIDDHDTDTATTTEREVTV